MSTEQRQGLFKTAQLTEGERAEVLQLADLCNAYEHLHMRFPMLMQSTPQTVAENFLYYEHDRLVGYGAFDNEAMELTGMVHPAYRRRGIFGTMLNELIGDCERRGINFLTFVCEQSSVSGQAFLQTKREALTLTLTEHEMVLRDFRPRPISGEHVLIEQVTPANMEKAVSVPVADGEDAEEMRTFISSTLENPSEQFLLGSLADVPIGVVRLVDMGKRVGIYTFNVHPAYRGRGYGRQILEEAIRIAQAQQPDEIMLEVNMYNENALGLYLSCGFEVNTTYEYYCMMLTEYPPLSCGYENSGSDGTIPG